MAAVLLCGCAISPPRAGVGEVCRRDRDCEEALVCLSHECVRRGGGGSSTGPDAMVQRDAGHDAGEVRDSGPDAPAAPDAPGGDDAGPVDAGMEEDAASDAGESILDADLPDVSLPLDV